MSLTITISSCLLPDKGTMCSDGSSRMPAVNSAYISATRFGVSRKPSRFGSSPMPSRMRRTPLAMRSRSTAFARAGLPRLLLIEVTLLLIEKLLRWFLRQVSSAGRVLDFAQGDPGGLGDRATLFKLRHRFYVAVRMDDFNIDRAEFRLHADSFARQSAAIDFITARANRRRLGKQQLQKLLAFTWAAEY